MPTPHNPIGDAVDEAVVTLTRLAQLTIQTSDLAGQGISFADRLAQTLTHVVANMHGLEKILTNATSEIAAPLRAFVADTFICW